MAAKEGVPVSDLGLDQLNQLQKQLDQEIEFFTESFKALKLFDAKNAKSAAALVTLGNSKPGSQALIPLCESLYVRAELEDPSKTLVEIGTGYYAEMANEAAQKFFARKQEYVAKQIETVVKLLNEKKRSKVLIQENMQAKIQQQIAALPGMPGGK